MTPLEMVKSRNDRVEWCSQCPKMEIINNTLFCGESGKILLPQFAYPHSYCNGPQMGCSQMRWKKEIQVVGNYNESGHEASRVVLPTGIAPTIKENHGTITGIVVGEEENDGVSAEE